MKRWQEGWSKEELAGQSWHFPWPSAISWLRYHLSWKGWRVTLPVGPDFKQQPGWKLHRCADNHECRAEIGGGCARGWCAHFLVKPDDAGVPRLPESRWMPVRLVKQRDVE